MLEVACSGAVLPSRNEKGGQADTARVRETRTQSVFGNNNPCKDSPLPYVYPGG